MLDSRLRAQFGPVLDAAGARVAAWGVAPNALTLAGLVAGVGAAVAAATTQWSLALALWITNRVLDALDGPVARVRGSTHHGGFLDIVADFAVYGAFVAGVGVGSAEARLACLVLLLTYYISGTALLALSSISERKAVLAGDERSLRFVGGLAESTETFVVYVLFCLFPSSAEPIAWFFAVAVAITAVQRVVFGVRALRDQPHGA